MRKISGATNKGHHRTINYQTEKEKGEKEKRFFYLLVLLFSHCFYLRQEGRKKTTRSVEKFQDKETKGKLNTINYEQKKKMPRCYILKKAHAQHNPIQPYGKRTVRNSKGKTTTTITPNNATKRNIISNNNNNNNGSNGSNSESCDKKNQPHIRVAVIQVQE